jgi:hypothetical protein
MVQEIYVDKNKYHSKHDRIKDLLSAWVPSSIFSTKTKDPDYAPKRKTISTAFFKKRLDTVTEIIKDVTYK